MDKYAQLTSLKQTKRLNNQTIYTFDCETKDGLIGKQLFCWSLCNNIQNNNFHVISGFSIAELIEYFKETYNQKKKKFIYCHNLTFDIRFILEYCMLNNIVCEPIFSGSDCIFAYIKELNIKFMDSFQFLKDSQEKCEITYNVDEKYRKIDCHDLFKTDFKNWSDSDKERVIAHNKNDVIALNIIMNKFRSEMFEVSNVDILQINTPASLSMKAFRKTLETPIVNPFVIQQFDVSKKRVVYDIEKEKEKFARMSYYGGRTECINHNQLQFCFYIDKVSMYPFVMKKHEYPSGVPFWETEHSEIEKYLKKGNLAIVECNVIAPNIHLPVLPFKTDKLLFPTGKFTGVYCSPEILYALKCGYKIEYLRALIYPSKIRPFEKFVDTFIEIKNKSSGGKREGSKLILNSCYGKFGQKFRRESIKVKFFNSQMEGLEAYYEMKDKDIECEYNQIINSIWELKYKEITYSIKPFMNVSIASFVTCYARLELLKEAHFQESIGNNVYYMDTDSLVLKVLPKTLSKELGGWNIEKAFTFFKCYAPKCYIFKQSEEFNKLLNKLKDIEEIKEFCKHTNEYQDEFGLKLKGLPKSERVKILENNKTIEELEKEIKNNRIYFSEKYLTVKESLNRNKSFLSSDIKHKQFTFINSKRLTKTDNTTIPIQIQ